jgi:hypothetical protein
MSSSGKEVEPREQNSTTALIEQMAKMMTQMAVMQAAAMSNTQPAIHGVVMTKGGMQSKSIDVRGGVRKNR